MKTVSEKIQFPYKIPLVIVIVTVAFHAFLESQNTTDELYLGIGLILVTMSLAVSASCFVVSRIYGYSRIFGISYLILGVGYFFSFLGELSFVYYVDWLGEESSPILGEISFLILYVLILTHMAINIRYFADRLVFYQKILLSVIPIVMVLSYTHIVLDTGNVDYSQFPYSLVAISLSSLTVSFAIVGLTLFKKSALIIAWFLLLIGMFVGTIGDIANYYLVALGDFSSISNYSTTLWVASNAIIIYALYKHQKVI